MPDDMDIPEKGRHCSVKSDSLIVRGARESRAAKGRMPADRVIIAIDISGDCIFDLVA
jgi:hypothetical protein